MTAGCYCLCGRPYFHLFFLWAPSSAAFSASFLPGFSSFLRWTSRVQMCRKTVFLRKLPTEGQMSCLSLEMQFKRRWREKISWENLLKLRMSFEFASQQLILFRCSLCQRPQEVEWWWNGRSWCIITVVNYSTSTLTVCLFSPYCTCSSWKMEMFLHLTSNCSRTCSALSFTPDCTSRRLLPASLSGFLIALLLLLLLPALHSCWYWKINCACESSGFCCLQEVGLRRRRHHERSVRL